jgi:mannosyltransferase OCH1-like enzyme
MNRNDIGMNARIIWQLLNEKGALPVSVIKVYTKCSSEYVFYAIGWLAREDKIFFFEKDGIGYVQLINRFSEMYY